MRSGGVAALFHHIEVRVQTTGEKTTDEAVRDGLDALILETTKMEDKFEDEMKRIQQPQ